MLYSNEDFENFYVRYKAEALPKNITVKAFCLHNNVPWNLFDKWYRDTRHRIAPVTVEGRPSEGAEPKEGWTDDNPKPGSVAWLDMHPEEKARKESVRIMVDIRMSNGMQVRQKNLSYERLVKLVEKLEELC